MLVLTYLNKKWFIFWGTNFGGICDSGNGIDFFTDTWSLSSRSKNSFAATQSGKGQRLRRKTDGRDSEPAVVVAVSRVNGVAESRWKGTTTTITTIGIR